MNTYSFQTMKIAITTILLFFILANAQAQSDADKVQVIQALTDHPAVVGNFPTQADGSLHQRYIINEPYSFDAGVQQALQNVFVFAANESALPADAASWLMFRYMEFDGNVANVYVNLVVPQGGEFPEINSFEAQLQYNGSHWQVTNLTIGGK